MLHGKKLAASLRLQITLMVALGVLMALFVSYGALGGSARAGEKPPQSGEMLPGPGVAADPSQLAALADGIVTRAEYDAAVSRTVACVEASGSEVIGKRYEYFRDRPVWNFVIKNNAAVSPDELSPYDECWMKYERDVQTQWVTQHEPSDAKKAANAAAAQACADEEGLGVDNLDALRAIMRSGASGNAEGVLRCVTIVVQGYDRAVHPSIAISTD